MLYKPAALGCNIIFSIYDASSSIYCTNAAMYGTRYPYMKPNNQYINSFYNISIYGTEVAIYKLAITLYDINSSIYGTKVAIYGTRYPYMEPNNQYINSFYKI
jgi:hypothetical protein